jgi:hypothetical protein
MSPTAYEVGAKVVEVVVDVVDVELVVVVVVVVVVAGTDVVVVAVVDVVDEPTTVITCFDPVPRDGEYTTSVCSPGVRLAGIVPVNVPSPRALLVTHPMTWGFDATTNCTISLGSNPEKFTEIGSPAFTVPAGNNGVTASGSA